MTRCSTFPLWVKPSLKSQPKKKRSTATVAAPFASSLSGIALRVENLGCIRIRIQVNSHTSIVKRPTETAAKVPNGTSDKYQRILDAAIEVIAEHGFFHSRVAEIASRAGVADGTIYLYFKNKDELLMAAIDSAFHQFIQRARTALAQIPEPREKLRRMAFLHLEVLGSDRNLAVVFQTELRHSLKFLGQLSHNLMVEYFDLIKSVMR